MDKELLENRKEIILDIINSPNYTPMKAKEIAMLLNVPKEDRADLDYVLNELLAEGKISVSKKGKYDKLGGNLVVGEFIANQNGYGFVAVEGEEDDIFIPAGKTLNALHKDTVMVAIRKGKSDDKKRREGEVIRIIAHNATEIVGTFTKNTSFGFVVPDNKKFNRDIFISKSHCNGAMTGHKVVVELTFFGDDERKPEGIVKEIIGHVNDPKTDILAIVKAYGIPTEYPDDVMEQVASMPDEVSSKDMGGRLDLRNELTVTIDGEDAKDLDDAITLKKEGDKYVLGVHIADVTNYVTEGSPLDREALKRGTSVYLVDRVIPMLPHKLSNGICSLNAGCDRLALSCIMEIDNKGKVIGHKIAETVINVNERMSYTSVKKILDGDTEECDKYKDIVDFFKLMDELAGLLRKKRMDRGAIDFDFKESKIILDEKGEPIEIKPYERNEATKIIEDFMLIANETVAEDFFWQELPFVYRTHDNPDPEKMLKLAMFISNFGYGIKTTDYDIHPKELQKLLGRISGTDEEALISRLTLRSMKQARYTTVNSGHFGLATQYYCHFTSPIRRYPDLQIHRIIKENLRGGLAERRVKHYDGILPEVSEHSSYTERRAEDAERDTEKLKKVQYMSKRIGEVYDGVISGITQYGLYVELHNTVEGMVRVASLDDDYYYYDEEKYEMIGQSTGKSYKLGQRVKIRVAAADKIMRTIDFELELEEEENENE